MKQVRKFYIVFVISVAFVLGFGVHAEASVDESLIKESEEKVDKLEEQKSKIKDEINEKEKTIEELMLKVELLQDEKIQIEKDIEKNEKEILKVEKKIERVQEEIDELQESIDIRAEIIGNRLSSYQSKGGINYLDVLFGSEGFVDFISRAHTVSVIIKADNDIIQSLKDDLNLVEEKMNEVKSMKSELKRIKRENEDKKSELENNIEQTIESKKNLDKQIEELNVNTEEIEKEQNKLIEKINKELGMKAELGDGKLEWPTDGGYISSGIGNRTHPITGDTRFHKGIDIARTDRSVSPPIYAAEKGIVTRVASDSGYGNMIKIKHENGLETLYAHLAKVNVKVGQEVRRGQTIGIMGTTGSSTGIHLHFEVYEDGSLQNPLRYIK